MFDILSAITPARLRRRLGELCGSDPAVTVESYLLGGERLLEWAHSVGVGRDRGLRAAVSPVAPKKLRAKTASPDEEVFLWTGIVDLANFFGIAARHMVRPPGRRLRILDFGCGCGRMTRYLDMMDEVQASASDIDSSMVKWCRQNLKNVATVQNEALPPMPLPDGAFDVVYSMSIFTHLPEASATKWLADFARVTAPGGLVILTTHAYTALDIIRGSKVHQDMFNLSPAQTEDIVRRLKSERFIFLPYGWYILKFGQTGPDYGNCFIDPDYVRAEWNNPDFDVLEYIPGGLRGWQDIVVLRRKP